jgi:hypothetical protein
MTTKLPLLFFTVVVCMQADANRKSSKSDKRFESRPFGERGEARGGSKL